MLYDERSKNDSKNISMKRQRRSLRPQNVTDNKMQGKHWQRSLLTGGAAARSPDQVEREVPRRQARRARAEHAVKWSLMPGKNYWKENP